MSGNGCCWRVNKTSCISSNVNFQEPNEPLPETSWIILDRGSGANLNLQPRKRCSKRATAAKDVRRGHILHTWYGAAEHRQRQCVECSQMPDSTWYNQELSKYCWVLRCELIPIALIPFSSMWPAEWVYMYGHMCVEYSPSVYLANGQVYSLRWGAAVSSGNDLVQSQSAWHQEYTDLFMDGHLLGCD